MLDLFGSGLLSLVAFLAVISFVVVIHELGHYAAGRVFGVHAEAFSLGFGPRLIGWKDHSGTDWRLSAFPVGGFVMFRGDANAASVPKREALEQLRAQTADADTILHFKPVWQRAIITAAGPAVNFLLAIAIFTVVGFSQGDYADEFEISAVAPGSAAEQAGLQPGDQITALDGRQIVNFNDVVQYVSVRAGQEIEISVDRGGVPVTLNATPQRTLRNDGLGGERPMGMLGVEARQVADRERICCSLWQAPIYGVATTWEITAMTGDYLLRLVTGRASLDMVNGPLGIATTAGQVANAAAAAPEPGVAGGETGIEPAAPSFFERFGRVFMSLLAFAGLLSVAIGLMNLLPIPLLDGGHLVYYAYEAIAQKPPSVAVQEFAYRAGFLLLIGVLVVATWNDLSYLRGLFT